MRKCDSCFLVLLLLVPLTIAKDKSQLPKLVVVAKYVMVTTYLGDQPSNPRIMTDDRQAMGDVQDAIKDWGRYIVVYRPKDADLIILVRKAASLRHSGECASTLAQTHQTLRLGPASMPTPEIPKT